MTYRFQFMLKSLAAQIRTANPGISEEEALRLAAKIGDVREWDSNRKHVLLREKGQLVKKVRIVP